MNTVVAGVVCDRNIKSSWLENISLMDVSTAAIPRAATDLPDSGSDAKVAIQTRLVKAVVAPGEKQDALARRKEALRTHATDVAESLFLVIIHHHRRGTTCCTRTGHDKMNSTQKNRLENDVITV